MSYNTGYKRTLCTPLTYNIWFVWVFVTHIFANALDCLLLCNCKFIVCFLLVLSHNILAYVAYEWTCLSQEAEVASPFIAHLTLYSSLHCKFVFMTISDAGTKLFPNASLLWWTSSRVMQSLSIYPSIIYTTWTIIWREAFTILSFLTSK
jgi:hypothetical protein